MGIEIKEVLTKKDLWTWVRFPNKLYKDNEFFVPFLENDEFETFSQDKNPAYAYCETRLFLAYKDGKVVGKLQALSTERITKSGTRMLFALQGLTSLMIMKYPKRYLMLL